MAVEKIQGLAAISKSSNKFFEKTEAKTQNITIPAQITNISKEASNAYGSYFKASQALNPNFTGHNCKTNEFKVKQLSHIPCACCGKDMLTDAEKGAFKSKASSVQGEDLVKVLNEYMEYFRPDEKAVVRCILDNAKNTQNATLNSAFPKKNDSVEKIYHKGQNAILNDVSIKAKELYSEENSVSRAINGYLNISNKGKSFNREQFLEDLGKAADISGNEEAKHTLMDIAISLPTDIKVIERMIKKYSGTKSMVIAERLINPAIMTAEHVYPHALGGKDNTANYIGECADCNNDRGTIPLETWLKRYPNMPHSSQRYIDEVTERIAKGEVGAHYEDYPLDVEKVMKKETNGVIRLKVKNPEEIDKMREEKGYAKPDPNEPLPDEIRQQKKEQYQNNIVTT